MMQTLTKIKRSQEGNFIDSFYCFHSNKGPAVLFINKDFLWCQNGSEEIFRIKVNEIVSVEYSKRNFYRINHPQGQHKICYLHEVEWGDKAGGIAASVDPEITKRFIDQLSSLGVKSSVQPHHKVLFMPNNFAGYKYGLRTGSLIRILLLIVVAGLAYLLLI
jgi:hypothetical protein